MCAQSIVSEVSYKCISIYVCMFGMYVSMCVRLYVCMSVWHCVGMYVRIGVLLCVCICVYVCVFGSCLAEWMYVCLVCLPQHVCMCA